MRYRVAGYPAIVARFADSLGIGEFGVIGTSGGGRYALSCGSALAERLWRVHARASGPDHAYYAQVKERIDGKRAALSEACKIIRQAVHILAEFGDDALTAC